MAGAGHPFRHRHRGRAAAPTSSCAILPRKSGRWRASSIIVENRVGAGGNLAIEYVARAKPDGYTILLWGGNAIAGMMSLLKNPPIDVAKTLQLAATINRQAFMFVVDAKTPYKTLDDLTKAMLAKGDKASYATSTVDATVMGEIYKAKTGVQAVEVPYKTAADTINDMISGALDYAVHNPVLALAQQREGKMRILGVGSNERLQAVPDLPTMTEQGVPMNVIGWWAATVPAGTPKPAVDLINKWFVDVVSTDETKKFLNNLGGDPLITDARAGAGDDAEGHRQLARVRAYRQDHAAELSASDRNSRRLHAERGDTGAHHGGRVAPRQTPAPPAGSGDCRRAENRSSPAQSAKIQGHTSWQPSRSRCPNRRGPARPRRQRRCASAAGWRSRAGAHRSASDRSGCACRRRHCG